jgi:hypothetical protein
MANTVIAVRSSGIAAATPSLGVIANGELSLNFADGILYYKSSSNTLGSIRTTAVSGLTTEVQFNDAGSFGANANFTFNKTLATLNVKNINASTNLVTTNLTATSITTGTGVGGIIAGANVIYSNVFVANSGGYVQFADGTKQYTANAGGALSNTQILAGLQTVSNTANITFDTIIVANNGIGRSIRIGDDAWIGDVNLQDTIAIRGAFSAANAYIVFGSADSTALGRAGAGALTYGGNTVWHAGNDGVGSGLDADLLDGFPHTAFANATFANTDYTTISTTAGVYGNASHVPVTTLTANGRVSSITNTAIAIDTAAITSGTLAVARGGTGVTTSTGTGAVVLNTSPTLVNVSVSSVNVTNTTVSTSNTTGALIVGGGVGVKGNVSADAINFSDGTRQTSAGASIGDVLALSIALG